MLRAMDQKELWMVQAVDQGAIEAAMGAASDGSGSNGRSDFVQVMHQRAVGMDQRAIGGAMDAASYGSMDVTSV